MASWQRLLALSAQNQLHSKGHPSTKSLLLVTTSGHLLGSLHWYRSSDTETLIVKTVRMIMETATRTIGFIDLAFVIIFTFDLSSTLLDAQIGCVVFNGTYLLGSRTSSLLPLLPSSRVADISICPLPPFPEFSAAEKSTMRDRRTMPKGKSQRRPVTIIMWASRHRLMETFVHNGWWYNGRNKLFSLCMHYAANAWKCQIYMTTKTVDMTYSSV